MNFTDSGEIKDDGKREKLNDIWKDKVLSLKKDDDKGDETFIKAWLRAQYAETIRETKAGAVNKDFDIIGGSFHKWVHDERDKLGLSSTDDYELFIMKFAKYADIYMQIRKAECTFAEETKYVFYNAQVNFTQQAQLLLAPICYEDSWPVITEKMNLTARFIDLLITARVTNYRSVDYSTIKNFVFNVTKDIRRCTIDELKKKLNSHFENLAYDPATVLPELRLNSFTKKYIKNMLARITGFIEEQTGVASNYQNYMNTQTKNPFEIEHIITDHYEWFTDEYADQEEFRRWRNSVGALLLLHKSINASLNDAKYDYNLCIRNLDNILNADMLSALDHDENDDDEYQRAGNGLLDSLFAEIEALDPNSYSVKQYREYRAGVGFCNNTVRSYVAAELSKIYLPEYNEFFEKDTINLYGIGREKTAIFIKADIANAPSDKMIPVLFTQIIRILRRKAALNTGYKLIVPTCVILDDFMTRYDVEDLQGMITSANDSGISVIVLLKSEAQLESSYRVSARTVLSNFDTYIYLGGSDLVTCRRISIRAQKPLADVLALPVGKGIVVRRGSAPEVVGIINLDEMRGLF